MSLQSNWEQLDTMDCLCCGDTGQTQQRRHGIVSVLSLLSLLVLTCTNKQDISCLPTQDRQERQCGRTPRERLDREDMMGTVDLARLKPGDVIAVKLANKWARLAVWLQTLLTTRSIKYAHYGHVAVYFRTDELDRHWVIEAAPDGIGYRNIDDWKGSYGISNVDQPKTEEQRGKIVDLLEELTKARYDYTAYFHFALESVGISPSWIREYDGTVLPPSYVCSALADFVYEAMQLANPGGDAETRFTTPAEWAKFIDERKWER